MTVAMTVINQRKQKCRLWERKKLREKNYITPPDKGGGICVSVCLRVSKKIRGWGGGGGWLYGTVMILRRYMLGIYFRSVG